MGIHRAPLAAWQQEVLATAHFVKSERDRLLSRDRGNDDATCQSHPATDLPLVAALQVAGVQENGEPVQRGSRTGGPVNWLANAWTGRSIKGAFVHLHLALTGLVDLYTDDEIKAHSPAVLARMQYCLAATDRRRQEAEALFGTVPGGAPAGTTRPQRIHSGVGSAADGNGTVTELCRRRAAFREAMRISYEAADEQYARIRMLRNTLIIAAAVLTALVAVVCIVGLRLPTAISHQLGLPVGSIGPTRARCLPKLAATTTIRALELGGSDSTSIAHAA